MEEDRRYWQREALAAWLKADCRGIVEAATATGKTRLAIMAIRELRRQFPKLRVAVVVPKLVLAAQWVGDLKNELGLSSHEVAEMHSGSKATDHSLENFVVIVIDSARTRLAAVHSRWQAWDAAPKTLLIVDECHRAGSAQNSLVLDIPFTFKLGISATVERNDRGDERYLVPGLGKVVYTYGLRQAHDDEVIAPVRAVNLYVRFDARERSAWIELAHEADLLAGVILAKHGSLSRRRLKELEQDDATIARLLLVLERQEELIDGCTSRVACIYDIIDWIERSNEPTLVFHERLTAAEQIWAELVAREVAAVVEHSQLPRDERARAIRGFRSGRARVLVAVRALDEGVNVPRASVAVIAAGSRSRRQRIQRVGRVIRLHADKTSALVISVFVLSSPEAVLVGGRDDELFGKVTHHVWPQTRVADAVNSTTSTFEPPSVCTGAGLLALARFLGCAADEAMGELEADLQPLDEVVAEAGRAFKKRAWNDFVRLVRSSATELGRLGAAEDRVWRLKGSTAPEGIPEAFVVGETERTVERCLAQARVALRRPEKPGKYTRIVSRLCAAQDALNEAAQRSVDHDEALQDDQVRARMVRLVEEAERVARDRPSVVAARRLRKICVSKMRNAGYLTVRTEYRELQSRLVAAVRTTRDSIVDEAEETAPVGDRAPRYDRFVELQNAWQELPSRYQHTPDQALATRMISASTRAFVTLVADAERVVAERPPDLNERMERLCSFWTRCEGPLQPDVAANLRERMEKAATGAGCTPRFSVRSAEIRKARAMKGSV